MDKLVETYCEVDDFCHLFMEQWQRTLLEVGDIKRRRACRLSSAKIMTLIIHFHQSHYRDFKNYYLHNVCRHLTTYFPGLLSYTRFLGITSSVVVPMCWSFGFKLHFIINHLGEIVSLKLTKGNVDGRKPVSVMANSTATKDISVKPYRANYSIKALN
jgi:hypothetical protein